MVTVIIGFLLVNVALYACVPMEMLRRESTVVVARMRFQLDLVLVTACSRSRFKPSQYV